MTKHRGNKLSSGYRRKCKASLFYLPGRGHEARCYDDIIWVSEIRPMGRTILYPPVHRRQGVKWHCMSELRTRVLITGIKDKCVLREGGILTNTVCILTYWDPSCMKQDEKRVQGLCVHPGCSHQVEEASTPFCSD